MYVHVYACVHLEMCCMKCTVYLLLYVSVEKSHFTLQSCAATAPHLSEVDMDNWSHYIMYVKLDITSSNPTQFLACSCFKYFPSSSYMYMYVWLLHAWRVKALITCSFSSKVSTFVLKILSWRGRERHYNHMGVVYRTAMYSSSSLHHTVLPIHCTCV